MINVLRVIPSMDPESGGPCQGIRNMIPVLEKSGVHNEVACLDDPFNSYLGKDPFFINALGPSKGPWQYSSSLLPWLIENLQRFDIVIVHALWLYHGYAVRKAMRVLQERQADPANQKALPRIFVMPHGMLDPYFQKAGDRKIKAARNWLYWKLIENKLVNKADGVLFTCEAELLLARQSFRPYRPQKQMNIGYGVPAPPPFMPSMKNALLDNCPGIKGHTYLLFLSRIHEKKGVHHLIEAYAKLLHTQPETTAILPKLVIAGPGLNSAYGQRLRLMVASSKALQHAVYFPGMLTGDQKWGAFYECEAFILPSHQENFGIAVVEALACGKPVLLTYQVNIWREIIEDGAGIVADDTVSGAELLLNSWQQLSAASKATMAKQAKKCFHNHFDIDTAAEKFCDRVVNE